MTSLTKEVCKEIEGIKPRDAERSKNFFALGLVSWLYQRPLEPTLDWIEKSSANPPKSLLLTMPPSRQAMPTGKPQKHLTTHTK